MRTYSSIIIDKVRYEWFATQDDEHPDFCLVIKGGLDIWVQVYLSHDERHHSEYYLSGREGQAIPNETAKAIIKKIISKGYLKTYENTNVGLMYSEGDLLEN